jgi:Flp pilus assembly protein TadD
LSTPDPQSSFTLATEHHRRGQFAQAESLYRTLIAQDPAHTDAVQMLGVLCNQTGRADEAISLLRLAIQLNPNRPDYFNNLGLVLAGQGKLQEAADALRRALSLSPDFPQALNNLGNVFRELGRLEEACNALSAAIAHEPSYAEAHANLGHVHQNLHDAALAITAYQRSLAQRDDPEVRLALASTCLLAGNLERGWPLYESRWEASGRQMNRGFSQPLWDGSDLAGRTILLHAEQGLGDTIQFIRYVPMVRQRSGRAIVLCPPELQRLLTGQLGIEQVVTDLNALPPFDVHCPILSLPRVFGTMLKSIPAQVPYLEPDQQLVGPWRQRLNALSPGLKAGLVWAGSRAHRRDRHRSIAPAKLARLAHAPGVRFISLQKGDAAATPPDMPLVDWTGELHDLADTAALVSNLDLMISADTAVAHLAGALARPVWLLLPFSPDWRWMWDRPDSPWYPTMRLFRQTTPGDWEGVIGRVLGALQALRP